MLRLDDEHLVLDGCFTIVAAVKRVLEVNHAGGNGVHGVCGGTLVGLLPLPVEVRRVAHFEHAVTIRQVVSRNGVLVRGETTRDLLLAARGADDHLDPELGVHEAVRVIVLLDVLLEAGEKALVIVLVTTDVEIDTTLVRDLAEVAKLDAILPIALVTVHDDPRVLRTVLVSLGEVGAKPSELALLLTLVGEVLVHLGVDGDEVDIRLVERIPEVGVGARVATKVIVANVAIVVVGKVTFLLVVANSEHVGHIRSNGLELVHELVTAATVSVVEIVSNIANVKDAMELPICGTVEKRLEGPVHVGHTVVTVYGPNAGRGGDKGEYLRNTTGEALVTNLVVEAGVAREHGEDHGVNVRSVLEVVEDCVVTTSNLGQGLVTGAVVDVGGESTGLGRLGVLLSYIRSRVRGVGDQVATITCELDTCLLRSMISHRDRDDESERGNDKPLSGRHCLKLNQWDMYRWGKHM